MRMDEPMMEEPPSEVESGPVDNETHSALWARPPVEAFDSKEKAITFQVSFRPFQKNDADGTRARYLTCNLFCVTLRIVYWLRREAPRPAKGNRECLALHVHESRVCDGEATQWD